MRITQSNKKNFDHSRGFTLIEMSIVLMIVGLIIASSATAYVQWQEWQRFETTKNNVATAQTAIETFLAQNGRYPCPASLDALRTDLAANAYGTEPAPAQDCNNVAAANLDLNANGADDVFLVNGARSIIYRLAGTNVDLVTAATPNVRIGTIPFRTLGLDESQAYDGYRNRLFYAVTEHLASLDSFDSTTGAIQVLDNGNVPYTNPAGAAHYIVFSSGENGAGGFTVEGVQTACPAAPAIENENCDLGDAIFLVDSYSTSGGNNNLDDIAAFGRVETPTWTRPNNTAATNDPTDGVARPPTIGGNVGFGFFASQDPEEEMEVSGVIRVQDDPLTPEIEGKVKASRLCDSTDPSDPDCFDISVISGALADSQGMTCPNPNEYIVGIKNNAPVCEVISITCPGNKIIRGINADGTVNCGNPPSPGCDTAEVTVCSPNDFTLLPATHGQIRTASGGTNVGNERKQRYRCLSGTWKKHGGAWGLCSCSEASYSPRYNVSCNTNSACGRQFDGTKDDIINRVCPSGATSRDTTRDGCTCVESEKQDTAECRTSSTVNLVPSQPPSGSSYNDGTITSVRRNSCTTNTCSAAEHVSDTCGCKVDAPVPLAPKACPPGFLGQIQVTEEFVCPDGEGVGKWGQPLIIEDDSACDCNGSEPDGYRTCPDGKVPIDPDTHNGIPQTITRTLNGASCDTTTTDDGPVDNYCQPPPALICAWTVNLGAQPSPGLTPADSEGDPCDCETDTEIQNARCASGGDAFNCSCQVTGG